MNKLSTMFAERLTRVAKTSSLRHITILSAVVFCFSLMMFGQGGLATILGTITDPSGSVMPNVTVSITSQGTGQTRTVVTNESGQYTAPGLQIGTYDLKAQVSGFKVAEHKGVVLNVGDRVRTDFQMQVGTAQESITVEANAVKVQSDSGEVSDVITGQQVTELATNGRSIYTLFALTPGASSIQGDFITPTAVSGDSNVSINGQRAGHNLQLLDGGENLDRGGSSGSVMPSMDAIAEFRNQTSNYSAEYGLSSAATINTVIKSGTKQFHATLWEFDRNDALDARNYFNPAPQKVSELRFNTYGFNAGGQLPLWKSHPTFFFYNMEWRSLVQGGLLNQTVPLGSEYPDANGAGTGAVIPSTFNGKANPVVVPTSVPVSVLGANCPGGVLPANVIPGDAFPNNTIPDCMIDSNASALLTAGGKYGGIFPLPTNGAQFQGGNNSPTTVREEIARIDHQFSDKFSVFGHWVSEQTSQTYGTTQWSGDNVPSISDVFGNPSYSAVVHATYVISPTLLNETAFNYNGNRINIIPQGLVTAPSGFNFNRLFTGPNANDRIPAINLNGGTGSDYTANWTPWINKADDYQLRDDISWTKGAHQLKFGFSWALYKKIQDYFADTEGQFNFNGSFTSPSGCTASSSQICGSDFADFLLGTAQQYEEDAVKSSGHWNNISLAAYVQDNWRATHRLTLNLGLRWDGVPHTYEANEQSSNFYPNLYNTSDKAIFNGDGSINTTLTPASAFSPSPNPILAGLLFYTNGIGVGGKNGIPKGLAQSQWAEFGPRIGFAYDLTGQGKTVIRGGYGLMYERIQGNDMYNGATNTPFDASPTLHNVLLSNPGTNANTGTTISAANLPVLPVGITGIASSYPPPTTTQFSLGVQQALGANSVLSVSYVGSQGRHENDYRAINLPAEADLVGTTGLIKNPGNLNTDMTLAYPGFGGIRLSENEANSSYNSLQLDLHANLKKSLQAEFGYTYAHANDATTSNGSGGDLNNLTNPYVGWRYDYGPSVFDRRNVAFVNFVYSLPILNGNQSRVLKTAFGGWQVSGIVTMESGAPLNIGLNGSSASSVLANTSNRPDLTGSVSYPGTVAQWFNPAAFSAPACLTGPDCYGDLGHNVVRGPGRDNWSLSLFKNFVFSETRGSMIQLRAECFNPWNHTQFKGDYATGGISTNFGSNNFGAITGAFDPREFQLGAKLIF